jgi:hypothetical protein
MLKTYVRDKILYLLNNIQFMVLQQKLTPKELEKKRAKVGVVKSFFVWYK